MSIILPASFSSGEPDLSAPIFPSNRSEYITVLAHYHRAEIARMAGWRDRIDRTTNWALTVAAAMMSVSLSTPSAHHGVLLFAMLLVLLLLRIEARRYRFFDVYRARVRRMERNYYAQIFAPLPDSEPNWATILGDGLRKPTFFISAEEAMARRLRRNYVWVFTILLMAWLVKITSGKLQPGAGSDEVAFSFGETIRNAALGPLPGWLVIAIVTIFYGWIAYMMVKRFQRTGELVYGNVHV